MIGVLHLLTLKIQKTLNKSFAKLYQASVALLGSQNRESIGNSLFIHCILVKKQGTGLGGDISISKVVRVRLLHNYFLHGRFSNFQILKNGSKLVSLNRTGI